MKPNYNDISEVTDTDPLWYDSHGVPRFCEFDIKYRSNIYTNAVALCVVSCARCGKHFTIEINSNNLFSTGDFVQSVIESSFDGVYGDPPIHLHNGDICVGCTTVCNAVGVISLWVKDNSGPLKEVDIVSVMDEADDSEKVMLK